MTAGLVIDMNAVSTPLVLRHNGFGGSIRVKGVICRSAAAGSYAVSDSAQGYGTGANRALAANHHFRDCLVEYVEAEINADPNDFNVGVYFQNGVDGVTVGSVRLRHVGTTALASGAGSTAVRVNGPVLPGGLTIGKVIADRIGTAFSRPDDNGFVGAQGLVNIGEIAVTEKVGHMTFFRGNGSVRVGAWFAGDNTGETLFETLMIGTNTPDQVEIGPGQYGGSETQVFSASAGIVGNIAPLWRSVGASLSSPSGATYTAAQVQNRSGFVRITGAVGSGTDNIAVFPPPDYNGQKIRVIGKFSGRNDVTIPASASITGATIVFNAATPARELIGYNGLWAPLG